MDNWKTDQLQSEVAQLIAAMLHQPGTATVAALNNPHDRAMEMLSDYIHRQGHLPDEEVRRRIVRNAVHGLISREYEVLSRVEDGQAYNSSVTEHERQWCIKKGFAEKPGPSMAEVDTGERPSFARPAMTPFFYLTPQGRERLAWLKDRIYSL